MHGVRGLLFTRQEIHLSCHIDLWSITYTIVIGGNSNINYSESHPTLYVFVMLTYLLLFPHTTEGMAIPDLSSKNKVSASKWHSMSEVEKQHYFQLATQISVTPSNSVYSKWHETQRILSNSQENVITN